jgi:hypothetical protein
LAFLLLLFFFQAHNFLSADGNKLDNLITVQSSTSRTATIQVGFDMMPTETTDLFTPKKKRVSTTKRQDLYIYKKKPDNHKDKVESCGRQCRVPPYKEDNPNPLRQKTCLLKTINKKIYIDELAV